MHLQNEGYWLYEVCHGVSIRQFHKDKDGLVEYSLGKFVKAIAESEQYAGVHAGDKYGEAKNALS